MKPLFENESVIIRDAKPKEIPHLFIHRTKWEHDAISIKQNGFDLKRFGRTGEQNHGIYYCWADPKGVYALSVDQFTDIKSDKRPYVIFKANISKALILIEKPNAPKRPKPCLSNYFGNKVGGPLSKLLLQQGYQAILRPGLEQIILDTSIIQVVEIGNVRKFLQKKTPPSDITAERGVVD